MFKQVFLPIIAVALFIVLVGLLSQGKLDFFLAIKTSTPKLSAKVIKINNTEIEIEVAKSKEERQIGLSKRNSLGENKGMLFVFTKDSRPVFWMKDTLIPLDIIWINDGKIIGIDKYVKPEPSVNDSQLKKYSSPSIVDYVLEVNGGFCDKNDIKVGQSLSGLEQL